MLHFVEQQFITVCSGKYTHYLLAVGDKVKELSQWKDLVLIEIKDVASKKLGLEIFWTMKINEFHLQL